MRLRVKDGRESEGRAVTARIRVERKTQHHPARKRADFCRVVLHESTWRTTQREKQEEKTSITHIEDGFDFLGQHVRRYPNGKVLTTPSKKNVKAFLDKARRMLELHKTTPAGQLIGVLNPMIRGWANYQRFGASKATYNSVDNALFKRLWQWTRRRHPRKSATWVKEKYFGKDGGRNWVFFGETQQADGKTKLVRLRVATRTPITRHVQIRAEANPYDPA